MALNTTNEGDATTLLNVSTTTQLKVGAGRIDRVSVTTAGAVGAIHDVKQLTDIGAATLVAVVPASVGIFVIGMNVRNGLAYAPGAAQVASISFA